MSTHFNKTTRWSFLKSLRKRQAMLPFILGLCVGISLTSLYFSGIQSWSDQPPHDSTYRRTNTLGYVLRSVKAGDLADAADLGVTVPLYAGVMTAAKFMDTRTTACNNTWGQEVTKMEFFAQVGRLQKSSLPMVELEGVDDNVYPPQQKVFKMFQYICAHHVDNYRWFLRADDDTYFKIDLLMAFLARLDSQKLLQIGQHGFGTHNKKDTLGLNASYCMGGPGVIYSQAAVKALCPHLERCMHDVVSAEEDVELGRCVTKHTGIECTTIWEVTSLFHHSYQDLYVGLDNPYTDNLFNDPHVQRALSIHHLKLPWIMYRMHWHYMNKRKNRIYKRYSYMTKIKDLKASSSSVQENQYYFDKWEAFPPRNHDGNLVDNKVLDKAKSVMLGTALDQTLQSVKLLNAHVTVSSTNSIQYRIDYMCTPKNETMHHKSIMQVKMNQQIMQPQVSKNTQYEQPTALHVVVTSDSDKTLFPFLRSLKTMAWNVLITGLDFEVHVLSNSSNLRNTHEFKYLSTNQIRISAQSWFDYLSQFSHKYVIVLFTSQNHKLSTNDLKKCISTPVQGRQVFMKSNNLPVCKKNSSNCDHFNGTPVTCAYIDDVKNVFQQINTLHLNLKPHEYFKNTNLDIIFVTYNSFL